MASKLPETYSTATPVWRNPAADYFSLANSYQGHPCGLFEKQFFRCMEAYGAKMGRKFCDLEHRDFNECVTQEKQKQRHDAIQAEWKKKYSEGKVDKPYSDHVKFGEHTPDYFSYNRIW